MSSGLVVALIQNAGLLLAMVALFDFLTSAQTPLSSRPRQIVAGLAVAAVGCAMIQVSFTLLPGIIFDTRSVLLAIAGLFLGTIPTLIAAVITSAFRLFLGGAAAWTGVSVIVASSVIGLLWRRFRHRPLVETSARGLYALGLVVHLVMMALMFTLGVETGGSVVRTVGGPVMLVHPLATLALGTLFVRRLRFHQTAAALASSESRFRLLAENARDFIYRYDLAPERRFAWVSPSATSFSGYTPEEFYADPGLLLAIIHPDDRARFLAAKHGTDRSGQSFVVRWIRKDGQILWVDQRLTHVVDAAGILVAIEGFARDITASRQADERVRLALRGARQGTYELDLTTGRATVDEQYARNLGYDPATFEETNDAWLARLHPDDRERIEATFRDYVEGRIPEYRVEFRQQTRGGDWIWTLSLGSIVSRDAAGRPLRMLGTHTDIQALKEAEARTHRAQAETSRLLVDAERSRRALLSLVEDQQVAERRLVAAQRLAQSTLDALEELISVVDERGAIIAVNEAWRDAGSAGGARPDSISAGADYLGVCEGATGPDAEQGRAAAAGLRAVLEGRRASFAMEYPCGTPDGERWFRMQVTPVEGAGPARAVVAHEDITDRKRNESELRRLTEILETSQAAARVGAWELDLVTRSLLWTGETYRIHDLTPEDYTPTLANAMEFFTPESKVVLEEVLRKAAAGETGLDVELEMVTRSGRHKWIQFTPSVAMEGGRTARITAALQDITARKEAERERLELTAQLHQAQRLESLGSLAGGVAHDINNVLAAILGSASSQRSRLEAGDPLARPLDTIINACLRGRSVVRSLLYFAHSEGMESRGPVDLNTVARDIVALLENTTLKRVRFTMELEETLPLVEGDLSAMTHAVMNLCVNSIDAMPEGGEIRLRTRSRADGFVEMSVRDNGVGMSPEVRSKAIEPFFTTKPTGKGTGLGLAMVYGTVKAHEGTFEIDSAPGEGTEVILGFPGSSAGRSDAPDTAARAGSAAPPPSRLRILLIDDDELIRDAIGSLLEVEGHEVHLAPGGAEGLAGIEAGLAPDLVLLDVNMPGMTGGETLVRLLALRPDQLVLMCSGHGDEEMARLSTGRPNVRSIQKPFTLDELDAKLASFGLRG